MNIVPTNEIRIQTILDCYQIDPICGLVLYFYVLTIWFSYYYFNTLQDALEPHMSRNTLEYHWGKHHRAYVDNLNKQIVGTELGSKTLDDIIISTYNKGDFLPPFNNAAQV